MSADVWEEKQAESIRIKMKDMVSLAGSSHNSLSHALPQPTSSSLISTPSTPLLPPSLYTSKHIPNGNDKLFSFRLMVTNILSSLTFFQHLRKKIKLRYICLLSLLVIHTLLFLFATHSSILPFSIYSSSSQSQAAAIASISKQDRDSSLLSFSLFRAITPTAQLSILSQPLAHTYSLKSLRSDSTIEPSTPIRNDRINQRSTPEISKQSLIVDENDTSFPHLSSLPFSSLTDRLYWLQAGPSSHCSLTNSSYLIFKCERQSRIESREELYSTYSSSSNIITNSSTDMFGHSISWLNELVRAQYIALVSERILVIDDSACPASTSQSPFSKGEEDAFSLCCSYHSYFQPISRCPVPDLADPLYTQTIKIDTPLPYSSPFADSLIIEYSPSHSCFLEDEAKAAISISSQEYFTSNEMSETESEGELNVHRLISAWVFRLLPEIDNHIEGMFETLRDVLEHSNPVPTLPFMSSSYSPHNYLSLHISSLTSSQDIKQHLKVSRYHPFDDYVVAVRREVSTSGIKAVVVWGLDNEEQLSKLCNLLPHVSFIAVQELVLAYFFDLYPGTIENDPFLQLISQLYLLSGTTTHIGTYSSHITRLLSFLILKQTSTSQFSLIDSSPPIIDLDGDTWHSHCWSTAWHFYTAHPSKLPYTQHPAVNHLLSPPLLNSKVYAPLELVLVTGPVGTGVDEMKNFLSQSLHLNSNIDLTLAFTALFYYKYTVEEYIKKRDRFVRLVREVFADTHLNEGKDGNKRSSSVGLLQLEFAVSRIDQTEIALQHPDLSLLAHLITTFSLPVTLRIIVMTRHPLNIIRHNVYAYPNPLANYLRPEWQLMFEGKSVRDTMVSLAGDIASFDPLCYTFLLYENIFDAENRRESDRLAEFLGLASADVRAELQLYSNTNKNRLFPRVPMELTFLEQSVVNDLFVFASSLSMFDLRHPSSTSISYNYGKVYTKANVVVHELIEKSKRNNLQNDVDATNLKKDQPSFFSWLYQYQHPPLNDCKKLSVLVFDGYKHWNNDTALSTQVFDIVRSFTLALATGRILLIPDIPHSVINYIQPISSCSLNSVGLTANVDNIINNPNEFPADAVSGSKIVITHSHIIDLAFLSAITSYGSFENNINYDPPNKSRNILYPNSLGVYDFITSIVNYILTPSESTLDLIDQHIELHGLTLSTSISLVLPSDALTYSRDVYLGIFSRLFQLHPISLVLLSSAHSNCAYLDIPSKSFAVLESGEGGIIGDIESELMNMTKEEEQIKIEVPITKHHSNIPTHDSESSNNKTRLKRVLRFDGIQSLEDQIIRLYTMGKSRIILSTTASEDGLLLAAFSPSSNSLSRRASFMDLFGHSFLSSILQLNIHTYTKYCHEQYATSNQIAPDPPTASAARPFYAQPLITKTQHSSRIRFLFIAGLEGTGHHFMGHLLNSLRLFIETGLEVKHEQLTIDDQLSAFLWKLFSQHSLVSHDRAKRQLGIRIKWRISLHSNNNPHISAPIVYVINGIHMGEGGMMSYPNTDSGDKIMNHPVLPMIARLMEENGADFRIITLVRSPGSSFASTVKREHAREIVGLENAMYYQARVLHANLAFISIDTAAIDSKFSLILDLEQLHRSPLRHSHAIATHLGLPVPSVEQALLRMSTGFHVQASNSWYLNMNDSAIAMTQEFFSHSPHLSLSNGFFYSVGAINWQAVTVCTPIQQLKTLPLITSQTPILPLMFSLDGSGEEYLRLLLEQVTGIYTANTLGKILQSWPASVNLPWNIRDNVREMIHKRQFLLVSDVTTVHQSSNDTDRLFAQKYQILGELTPLLEDPKQFIMLLRNPFDTLITRVLPDIEAHKSHSPDAVLDFFSNRYNTWRVNYIGQLQKLIEEALSIENIQIWKNWRSKMKEYENKGGLIVWLEDVIAEPQKEINRILEYLGYVGDVDYSCILESHTRLHTPSSLLTSYPTPSTDAQRASLSPSYSTLDQLLLSSSWFDIKTESHPYRWSDLITYQYYDSIKDFFTADDMEPRIREYILKVGEILNKEWIRSSPAQPNFVPNTKPQVDTQTSLHDVNVLQAAIQKQNQIRSSQLAMEKATKLALQQQQQKKQVKIVLSDVTRQKIANRNPTTRKPRIS